MKSTGECLGIAKTFNEALYKAFEELESVFKIQENDCVRAPQRPGGGRGYCPQVCCCGISDICHQGTARTPNKNGVKAYETASWEQESPNIPDLVLGHQIDLIIDIPAQGAERSHDGFIIRRNAIETGVNV